MTLLRLKDFDPDYVNNFEGDNIKGLGVYTENDEKIGTVSDILVDEDGHFRYLVVDLGFWIFGKSVLLPMGRTRIDYKADRVYAVAMTKEQAEALPEFNDHMALDYDYEENVRGVYRNPVNHEALMNPVVDTAAPIETTAFIDTPSPLSTSAPLDAAYAASMTGAMPPQVSPATTYNYEDEASAPEGAVLPTVPTTYNRDTYNYQQEPSLYEMNDQDHQTFKLYEERLIANKNRMKTGEVVVGKRIETEIAQVSVPLEKERIVIERVSPTNTEAVVPDTVAFQKGEVARIETYEETPDIRKEAFVREEVSVRKEVNRETVDAQETLRREQLDVNTDGNLVVEHPSQLPNDRV
jgi:uncharacterized protein (TIGR02271 family)